jgi:hypothetical protein
LQSVKKAVVVREALDLAAPLGLQRGGAHDENARNARHPAQQLRNADALDRLAEAHVVGQDRAARAHREGDPIQLVGKQLTCDQLAAQPMAGGVRPDLRGLVREPLTQEPPLDELLGVGIDGDLHFEALEALQPFQQIAEILDGAPEEWPDDALDRRVERLRYAESELDTFRIVQIEGESAAPIGPRQLRPREAALDLALHVEHVLARPQRVLPEVGARAVGLPSLPTAKGHAVAAAGRRARHAVVGPRALRVRGTHGHAFLPRPLEALGQRAPVDLPFLEALRRDALGRGGGQAEQRLLFEDQGERRPGVLAGLGTVAALDQEPQPGRVGEANGHGGAGESKNEALAPELDLVVDLDLGRPTREQQLLAARREQLARLGVGQMGEAIAEAELVAASLLHEELPRDRTAFRKILVEG